MPGSFGRLTVILSLCSFLWQQPTPAHDFEGSVFRMSRDGSSIVRISAEKPGWGTASPRWAPDGQRVLYVAHTESKSEFHVVSAAGEKRMRVPVPSHITSVAGLCWGPDGTIVFAGGTAEGSYDIYLMKPGAGEAAIRRILGNGIQPAWSPDGRLLAFTTFRDGNLEVYVADSDGGNLRNLTRHEGHDARPAWLPDGRIAFESDRFGNLEICIAGVAGGEVVNLSNHPGQDQEPAISGDGREIAFVSNRDWNFHVYRMAVDGTGVGRLTAESVTNREPAWSPAGGSLCFVSNRPEPFFATLSRWFKGWLAGW